MRDFHMPGRSVVMAANGMAATSHPLASKVAVQMLEAGGNAVDAAIAAAVLQGVCEPQMTGIGGDMFALISRPGAPVVGLNASGRAPAGLDADKLRADGFGKLEAASAHSVTVPGAVDGFCRLAADHGSRPLADLLAPAIHYAEAGVPVAPRVASDWDEAAENLQGAAREALLKDGRAYKAGEVLRLPAMAQTLRRIAEGGRDAFYAGDVAEDMVATLRDAGGVHTAEDFAATACDYVEPVRGSYRGHELIELPPNGQGIAAILMLGILEQFDIAAMDPLGLERAHIEAEAAKLAYDARDRFVADADYMGGRLDHLLSKETAAQLAALISPDRAMPEPAAPSEDVHRDTIYLTVVDRDRMAVSLIYSIFRSFGSGIMAGRSGVLFHNRGSGFNLTPGHPNEAGPGKRPLHTIIPAMLARDGEVIMPFGVMGGQYQAHGHARFVSNLVDFGMDPQSAISAPRLFPYEGELRVERGYARAVHEGLAALGHNAVVPDGPIGGAQAILIDAEAGVLVGASDHRKDGCALGY